MSLPRVSVVLLATLLAACVQQPNSEPAARKELVRRNISIDLRGLKEATQSRNLDGAYLFEDVGFFASISSADFKEALQHAASTDNGCSALHFLAQDGSVEMIEFMVKSGAEVNKTCRGRETPLKWASYGNNTAVMDYLVSVGGTKT